jgi:hypothetical protein
LLEIFGRHEGTPVSHLTWWYQCRGPSALYATVVVKAYLPWESVASAARGVATDLKSLSADKRFGFFLMGKLDYRDKKGPRGLKEQKYSGQEWCTEVMKQAGQDLRRRSLVPSATGNSELDYLTFWLPPLTHWEENDRPPRTPTFTIGAWHVFNGFNSDDL